MLKAKSLVESRTFWIAVAQALIAADLIFTSKYPGAGWLLVVKSILDVFVRLNTTQSITSISPEN